MNEELSSFRLVEILLKVAILPIYTAHPMDAVKQQLNSILFKFSEEMQGIPLSYSTIDFPKGKEYGRIMNDQPWVHVDILTNLVVFVPTIGDRMKGKISRVLFVFSFAIIRSLIGRCLTTMCQYW